MPKSLIVAAQYRERAARLRADAEHVGSPKGREAFLNLAENWDLLADAAERGARQDDGGFAPQHFGRIDPDQKP